LRLAAAWGTLYTVIRVSNGRGDREMLMRFLQRSAIFGLGIFSVWLIVFVVFETADRRLPWILALGITYGFAAYVVLPRVIRLGLKILKRKRVPSYTITGDGLPETLSTSHSWVRYSSFDRPSQSSAGQKRIDWDWQAPGA
jgi:hypothetical protein